MPVQTERQQRIEQIAADLLPAASQLTRLVIRHVRGEVSRTEGGLLRTLSAGPRRITELAELEGLAQPTTTLTVKRMEERGWVARGRDAADGRVALISLTDAGRQALEAFRADYRAVLIGRMGAMADDRLAALEAAAAALHDLIEDLQGDNAR